jgi:hypothetical protein
VEQPGHKAEPKGGSLRTADGEEADLFALADYPVDAVCRVCKGAIRARSFMRPFEHVAPATEEGPATEG